MCLFNVSFGVVNDSFVVHSCNNPIMYTQFRINQIVKESKVYEHNVNATTCEQARAT